MQDQLCVQIDIGEQQAECPKRAQKIRNRRYKKLKELREAGFFSEDAIKLRHPLLYHHYLGNHTHRNTPSTHTEATLSEFLQKNLLNFEYKARLQEELSAMTAQERKEGGMDTEEWQTSSRSGETPVSEEISEHLQEKSWEIVEQQEIELEEENLIDHAEQLFLEGKVDRNYINYKEIDNNSDYDELQEEDQLAEERFFRTEESEEDEEINKKYYTGVEDY